MDGFAQAVGSSACREVETHARWHIIPPPSLKLEPFFYYRTSQYSSDGLRLAAAMQSWRFSNPDERPDPANGTTTRAFWDGRTWYQHFASSVDAKGMLRTTKQEIDKHQYLAIASPDGPLDGYLPGDSEPILAVLKRAKTVALRPEREEIRGRLCYVIDFSANTGSYALWLDPERDFQMVRASVRKRANDLRYGQKVSTPRPKPRAGPAAPPEALRNLPAMTEWWATVDQVESEQVRGRWIAVAGIVEQVARYEDGTLEIGRGEIFRTVALDPGLDPATFEPNFPEGAPVQDDTLRDYIPKEWSDGEVQPLLNAEVLKKIQEDVQKHR